MTGVEVRRIRLRLGLKQGEFGKLVGVHFTTVSRWETGKVLVREPMAKLIRLLAGTVKAKKGRS